MDIVEKASIFAAAAHAAVGQKRKYTGEPYIVHPAQVALITARLKGTPEMVAAAWLHDVVEDTQVDFDLITYMFGDKVSALVMWLTDVSTPEDGNRATRKAMDRAHIAKAPRDAQLVKLADLISNTESITKHDPDFAKIYLKEKAMTLDVLDKVDPYLIESVRRRDEKVMNYLLHGVEI